MSTLIVKNLDAPTGESLVAPDLQLSISSGDLPSGSVLQVKKVQCNGAKGTSSTSFVDAHSASITSIGANSTFLIMNNTPFQVKGNNGSFGLWHSVDNYTSSLQECFVYSENTSGMGWEQHPSSILVTHSPNQPAGTTITYKTKFKKTSGSSSGVYYFDGWGQTQTYNFVIMEIAG
jgi:hypothetical protein